jgi:hypothetical protein
MSFQKNISRICKIPSLFLILLSLQAYSAEDLSSAIYHIDIPETELNNIQTLLPEYGGVNPALVNNNTDPNIYLLAEADIAATFIDEGAGYKNTFGYFVFDDDQNILYEQTIFSNASEAGGGGTLNTGDSVMLGTFDAGTNIGFWVKANGYNNPDGHTYYTLDQYNPDGLRHMAIIYDADSEKLIIGIEDLYNLGDQDYNDLVFTFSATPNVALDLSSIPTGSPEASEVATLCISSSVFLWYLRRRKRVSVVTGPTLQLHFNNKGD